MNKWVVILLNQVLIRLDRKYLLIEDKILEIYFGSNIELCNGILNA